MSKDIWRVVVTREDDNWLASVDGLQGAHTYAGSLAKLDGYVREVIVLMADLPDDADAGLAVEYEYHIGDAGLDALTAEVRAERARMDAAEKVLAERTADLARRLKDRQLNVRDVAALLAVSPSRVSQVAPDRVAS